MYSAINKASHELMRFVYQYGEHKEILITDKYGALIAASNKTSDYFQGDELWWQKAWNNGQGGFYFSNPEFDESLDEVIVMISFSIYSDENIPIGVIRTNIEVSNVIRFLSNAKGGTTGKAYILDDNGDFLFRKDLDEHFEKLKFTGSGSNMNHGHGVTFNQFGIEIIYGYKKFEVSFVTNIQELIRESYIDAVKKLNWYIVYSQETSEAFQSIDVINKSILYTGLIILLVIIVLSILVIRVLLKPLRTMLHKGGQVLEGDFTVNIESNSNDEVGKLSRMFGDLLISLREMAATARKISAGDLTGEIKPRSEKDEMGIAFKTMTEFLRGQIDEINKAVSVLTSSNSQLMSTVSQVSASANETVTTVSEVTTTIEEVKQTAEVSAQKAKNVSESANKSVHISEKGIKSTEDSIEGMSHIQEQVKQIADTIIKLSEQSQTISEITSSVNDLAEQSNLLAVNASIEAVKAGEYGKGFGVVAQEIRVLADQSKQATKQIKEILNEVQKAISSAVMATEQGGKAVDQGVSLAEVSGDSISMLADSISEAAQASSQIAASSHQQLTGMEQLATAMENIKMATQQNAAGNKETEKAVESLKEIIENLKQLTVNYKI